MSDNSTMTGIEQDRAKQAYKYASKVEKNMKEKYSAHVKKVPMMIKTNGLGATFAFIFSKKDKEGGVYQEIGKNITDWINYDDKYLRYGMENKPEKFRDLVAKVVELKSPKYRALTIEVLALFNWLRRFAEGLIEGED
jgi:CRISPR-associated protein Cmr5